MRILYIIYNLVVKEENIIEEKKIREFYYSQ